MNAAAGKVSVLGLSVQEFEHQLLWHIQIDNGDEIWS